jgi:glycine hydroxymethyltransferase
MNLDSLRKSDSKVYDIVQSELNRQRGTLELIASENFTSKSVLETVGSVLTNKYAEGYPGRRYYGGCEHVDEVENLAKERLKRLFKCEYANVQPHSGSQANMGVFLTFLKPNDTVLGLNLSHGGHLTHGSPVNFSGKLYNFHSYGVLENTGRVDFDEVYKIAKQISPKLIICGGSAYPRFIEFEKFKEIADSVGAYLMADIAHPSGLIAANLHPSPFPYCDIATSTTHKTLRGPRGGIILLGNDFENKWGVVAPKSGRVKNISELIDSSIMPGVQGGPLMHVIAGKAVAFKEALSEDFKKYCKQILLNAKAFEQEFLSLGYELVSGGTDTHLLLIDLTSKNVSGKKAENSLESVGITTNKNMVPFDQRSPMVTSGIRIGTPSLTTRGMTENEMKIIAKQIDRIISNIDNEVIYKQVKKEVVELSNSFPLYQN